MKKCASELELEAFIRGREDAAEQKPGHAGLHAPFGVFSAADLSGFGFADSNALNGSIHNHLWPQSQNLSALHPALSTTIESQSSICGIASPAASPTSATNLNMKESQALGGSSGSDSDSESLLDTEGDPCEQSTNPMDVKRMRRMVSNRELARLSRNRKQAHLVDLESQLDNLRGENASLFKKLTDSNQQFTTVFTDNRILKSEAEALRVKVDNLRGEHASLFKQSSICGMASPWSPDVSIEEEGEDEQYAGEAEGSVQNRVVPAGAEATRHRKRARSKEVAAEASGQRKRAKSKESTTSEQKAPKSKVWLDFTKISPDNDEETVAKCNICHKVLRAASKNGTSHLLRHLRNVHPLNQNEVNNYFLKSERNDDGSHALKNYKLDQDYLRSGISMFLLWGSHPFTVVEEHGYRTMMGRACPQFKNISRHTIRRDIMAMFDRERKDLIEAISNSPGRVSFTSDNWKSEVTKYSFICITAHYIDAEWKLHKRIIWFKKLTPPYDGSSIADEVHMCFREWKVDTKIMCMTLDNASYNDKMIDALKTHLLLKSVLPVCGTHFQVRCCAHILNLIVQAGLKLIDKSVGKIREGIHYIKASSTRMHKFYDAAETIYKLDVTKKLRADMPIRWNSTYKMLGNALYFKDILFWFAERDNIFKSNFYPSFDEWEKLTIMHNFLKTFYDVTLIFSGTKYPTSNLYFKSVFLVQTRLLEALSAKKTFMTPMVVDMKEKFDKYWSDYNVFLSCAVVLDPRYKMEFVSFCYMKLYAPDDAQRRIDEVRTTLQSLFEGYRGSCAIPSLSEVDVANTSGGDTDLFSDYHQYLITRRTHEGKSQLDLYLDEPTRGWNENLDVLEFWSKSSMRYPELASMARDILAVPVSTVASESAFSVSRKVISPSRNSLKPKTIEALMCLQDWYHWKMHEANASTPSNVESSNVDESSSDSE